MFIAPIVIVALAPATPVAEPAAIQPVRTPMWWETAPEAYCACCDEVVPTYVLDGPDDVVIRREPIVFGKPLCGGCDTPITEETEA